ncbi:hypothetical protein [Sphingomonas sp. CARO-RG-8B-R24-01]|uniref:hypothetical protein n=1 Tax=Sphingomonas sp. CARO-RG-8B-R24-01 TaxID=2914831 RepID=UPI001F562616|nr:hypothetical protein [Sphingomonas sp. CARO-RG-8B-R24-01]
MTRQADVEWLAGTGADGAGADRRSVLVIADEAPISGRTTGGMAVLASGARLQAHLSWAEAGPRLERQALCRVILAETIGVADAVLEDVLPLLADLAGMRDASVVIVLEPSQIDLVASAIGAAPVDLLCAPSVAECVGSLCLALSPTLERVHEIGPNGEAARLMRLNEEIARIAETLTRLTRGEDEAVRVGLVTDTSLSYRTGPSADRSDIRVRDVRDTIRARRLRDQFFGAGLFEDPAWDMLLDLFAAELERVQVSVSSLCIAAAVAPTTALRWIARMTEAGLFERRPDPFDRRRAFMVLSARASLGMRNYVAAVRHAGLAIG